VGQHGNPAFCNECWNLELSTFALLLNCSIAQFKMRETGCAANSVSREPQSAEHVRLVKNRSPCWPSGHVPDCLSRNQKSCVAYRTHSSGSKYLSSLEL